MAIRIICTRLILPVVFLAASIFGLMCWNAHREDRARAAAALRLRRVCDSIFVLLATFPESVGPALAGKNGNSEIADELTNMLSKNLSIDGGELQLVDLIIDGESGMQRLGLLRFSGSGQFDAIASICCYPNYASVEIYTEPASVRGTVFFEVRHGNPGGKIFRILSGADYSMVRAVRGAIGSCPRSLLNVLVD